jgi:hypothetical protein
MASYGAPSYVSAASRASAAALATQVVASAPPRCVSALNDGTDILCAVFPALDPPVVRSVLSAHGNDAPALLTALCELAGEAPPPRAQLPGAPRCVARWLRRCARAVALTRVARASSLRSQRRRPGARC